MNREGKNREVTCFPVIKSHGMLEKNFEKTNKMKANKSRVKEQESHVFSSHQVSRYVIYNTL